jgi:hypothetical protein
MAKKAPILRPITDQAIGSWEACCLLGTHWTQPAIMSKKGLLSSRTLRSPVSDGDVRTFAIYSSRECLQDYDDYEQRQKSAKRRPRAHIYLRDEGLRHLRDVEPKIRYGDAIGVADAAEILGVHWTFPPRMVRSGKIVGRLIHNGRAGKTRDRLLIFSRESCEKNAAEAKRLLKKGTKTGRPRSGLS